MLQCVNGTKEFKLRLKVYEELKVILFADADGNYLLEEEVIRIIHSSLFRKEKLTMDGKLEKIKARYVAGGNEQDREFYGDISSPTVRTDSVLMIAVVSPENCSHYGYWGCVFKCRHGRSSSAYAYQQASFRFALPTR